MGDAEHPHRSARREGVRLVQGPPQLADVEPTSQEDGRPAHVAPEGLGTFHVWSLKPLPGVRFECFGVFTEFVPNKRIVDKWSMALEGTETYTFDTEGSGTRVTLEHANESSHLAPRAAGHAGGPGRRILTPVTCANIGLGFV